MSGKTRKSGKRRGESSKRIAPFTKVPTTWPKLLHEAGLSGVEWAVLVALAQHPQRNGLLSRPTSDYGIQEGLSTVTGCGEAQVRKALSALCRKTFVRPDGTEVPVLTRKVAGRLGKVAVFQCNLPDAWPDGEEREESRAIAQACTQSDAHEGIQSDTQQGIQSGTQQGAHIEPRDATDQIPHLEETERRRKERRRLSGLL